MKSKLTLLIIVMGLTSCDFKNSWNYKVVNNTKNRIKVEFNYKYDNHRGKTTKDTSIYVEKNQSSVVFKDYALGGTIYDREKRHSLERLTKFRVSTNDTVFYSEKSMSGDKWDYEEIDSHNADYVLILK
jgi:hypothetical protein